MAGQVLSILALAGCSGDSAGKDTKGPASPWAFEREFNKGAPASLIIRLDKVELSLADRVLMEEELRVEEGFEADFPQYLPEDFEGFSVVEISSEAPAAAGAQESGRGSATADAQEKRDSKSATGSPRITLRRKRLTLEPDKSGALVIAPLAVYFHRSGDDQESSFETEEVSIHVEGIKDLSALSVRGPQDIYEAPPLPSSPRGLLWAAASVAALGLAAAGVYYRMRRPRQGPPPIPPQEIAYEALRRLIALNLIEKGEIELFFVHLSAILREYIENRFQVRAPERTTEEFLEEAARDPTLEAHRALLGRFLALCDRVKFARYQPDDEAIQGAFDVLKRFLEETTPHDL